MIFREEESGTDGVVCRTRGRASVRDEKSVPNVAFVGARVVWPACTRQLFTAVVVDTFKRRKLTAMSTAGQQR